MEGSIISERNYDREPLLQGGTMSGRQYGRGAVWQGISMEFCIIIVVHNTPICIRYLGTF